MTTVIIGLGLIIAGPVALASFLAGAWHGRRSALWEQRLDKSWNAASEPLPEEVTEDTVYAADDDDAWLAGIKSRTDAFIALISSEVSKAA